MKKYIVSAKTTTPPLLDADFFEPLMGEHWDSHITTEQGVDYYYKKIRNMNDLKRFRWFGDYWGYASSYEERATKIYKALKPYYNKTISIELPKSYMRSEPKIVTGKLVCIAVDSQYPGHVEVLMQYDQE